MREGRIDGVAGRRKRFGVVLRRLRGVAFFLVGAAEQREHEAVVQVPLGELGDRRVVVPTLEGDVAGQVVVLRLFVGILSLVEQRR